MSYKNIEDGAGDAGDGHAAGTNGVQVESLSLLQRVRKMIPDTVNLDVLDLSISQPPRERFYLLTKYMQPWGEFFDISEYNLPIMAEYQTRLYANFGAFFYNCTLFFWFFPAFLSRQCLTFPSVL